MPMDATAISIISGIFACVLFVFLEFRRSGHLVDIRHNAFNIALVFVSASAVYPFVQLIWAAILGDPNELPSRWREYLAVTALVGIWMAVTHLFRVFGKALRAYENQEAE